MLNINIYVTSTCRYSPRALKLLDSISVHYNKIVVDTLEHWEEMEENTGRSTVPQIYVDECYIGGFDDLADLERKGRLRTILKRA
jgi:glutaredoxin 3